MFAACALLFVQPAKAERARAALHHALGAKRLEYLFALLAFIRTAHYLDDAPSGARSRRRREGAHGVAQRARDPSFARPRRSRLTRASYTRRATRRAARGSKADLGGVAERAPDRLDLARRGAQSPQANGPPNDRPAKGRLYGQTPSKSDHVWVELDAGPSHCRSDCGPIAPRAGPRFKFRTQSVPHAGGLAAASGRPVHGRGHRA